MRAGFATGKLSGVYPSGRQKSCPLSVLRGSACSVGRVEAGLFAPQADGGAWGVGDLGDFGVAVAFPFGEDALLEREDGFRRGALDPVEFLAGGVDDVAALVVGPAALVAAAVVEVRGEHFAGWVERVVVAAAGVVAGGGAV